MGTAHVRGTYIYAGTTLIHIHLKAGRADIRAVICSKSGTESWAQPGSTYLAKLLQFPSPQAKPPTTDTCEHLTYKLSIMGVDVHGLCTLEYRGMNFIR